MPYTPQELIGDFFSTWQSVEKDPAWAKLSPDMQTQVRHAYFRRITKQPDFARMFKQNPEVSSRLFQHFFAPEQMADDQRQAEVPAHFWDYPVSRAIGLTSENMEPGVAKGVARFAEGLTTPLNVGLLLGTGAVGKAVQAAWGLRAARTAQGVMSGAFAADMAKNLPEGIGQLSEIARLQKEAEEAGDSTSAEHYSKLKAQFVTELVLGAGATAWVAKHAIGSGRSGLFNRPMPSEVARLKAVGWTDAQIAQLPLNQVASFARARRGPMSVARVTGGEKNVPQQPVSTKGASSADVQAAPSQPPRVSDKLAMTVERREAESLTVREKVEHYEQNARVAEADGRPEIAAQWREMKADLLKESRQSTGGPSGTSVAQNGVVQSVPRKGKPAMATSAGASSGREVSTPAVAAPVLSNTEAALRDLDSQIASTRQQLRAQGQNVDGPTLDEMPTELQALYEKRAILERQAVSERGVRLPEVENEALKIQQAILKTDIELGIPAGGISSRGNVSLGTGLKGKLSRALNAIELKNQRMAEAKPGETVANPEGWLEPNQIEFLKSEVTRLEERKQTLHRYHSALLEGRDVKGTAAKNIVQAVENRSSKLEPRPNKRAATETAAGAKQATAVVPQAAPSIKYLPKDIEANADAVNLDAKIGKLDLAGVAKEIKELDTDHPMAPYVLQGLRTRLAELQQTSVGEGKPPAPAAVASAPKQAPLGESAKPAEAKPFEWVPGQAVVFKNPKGETHVGVVELTANGPRVRVGDRLVAAKPEWIVETGNAPQVQAEAPVSTGMDPITARIKSAVDRLRNGYDLREDEIAQLQKDAGRTLVASEKTLPDGRKVQRLMSKKKQLALLEQALLGRVRKTSTAEPVGPEAASVDDWRTVKTVYDALKKQSDLRDKIEAANKAEADQAMMAGRKPIFKKLPATGITPEQFQRVTKITSHLPRQGEEETFTRVLGKWLVEHAPKETKSEPSTAVEATPAVKSAKAVEPAAPVSTEASPVEGAIKADVKPDATLQAYSEAKPMLDELEKSNGPALEKLRRAVAGNERLPKEEKVKRYLQAAKVLKEGLDGKNPEAALENALNFVTGTQAVPRGLSILDREIKFGENFVGGGWGITYRQVINQIAQKVRAAQTPVNSQVWNRIDAARERANAPIGFRDRLAELPFNVVRRYAERFIDVPGAQGVARFAEKLGRPDLSQSGIERRIGRELAVEENPHHNFRMTYGGFGGTIEAINIDYAQIMGDANRQGLGQNLKALLDFRGYDRALRTIAEKRNTALQKAIQYRAAYNQLKADITSGAVSLDANVASKLNSLRKNMSAAKSEAKDYHKRLQANEIVPEGLDAQTIAGELQGMQRALGPQKWQALNGLADRFWAKNREAWDALYQEGIITDELYQRGIARGNEYIPLQRIMDQVAEDNVKFGRTSLQLKQTRMRFPLQGSTRINVDPYEASVRYHVEALREVARNQAARTLIELKDVDPTGWGALVKEVKQGYKPPADEGIVSHFDQGERRDFAVPRIIADVVSMARPGDIRSVGGPFASALILAKNVFQIGTTLANPGFGIPNVMRDTQDAIPLSYAAPRGPVDAAKAVGQWLGALKASLTKNQAARDEYLRSGAAYSTLQKNIAPEEFLIDSRIGLLGKLKHGRIIASVEELNNALEEATKLTVYKRLRARGYSSKEAAWETRNYGGSPDFGAQGTDSASVNLLVMFFNANLRGIARTYARMKEDPQKIGIYMGGLALAALLLDNHNAQFTADDGSLEDDHISDTDRNNYFYIIRPEVYQTSQGAIRHRVWKIPKGHVARLLMNPVQDLIRATRKESFDGVQTALDFLSNNLPGQFQLQKGKIMEGMGRGLTSSMNPLMREPLEQAMGKGGYDTFRGTPIVPTRLQDVEPGLKSVPTTSKTATTLARGIGTVAPDIAKVPVVGPMLTEPMRLEHAIRGFGGGVGEQLMNASDAFQGQATKIQGIELAGDERVANLPGVGPIARRFVGSTQDQVEKDLETRFYDLAAQSAQIKASFDMLVRSDPTAAMAYAMNPDKQRLLAAANAFAKLQKKVSEMRFLQQQIMQNENLPDAQKKQQIRQLYQAREILFKNSLAVIEPILMAKQ